PGAVDRRAARADGVLAPVPDGDPDLGTAGDVVRHPDRLYRHGVVRAFGVLRARDVRRGGGAVDGEAAQSVARDPLWPRRLGGNRAVRRLFQHPVARPLFRHHHAHLLADLLRHHLHLDRGDRRRERPDFSPPGAGNSRPVLGAVLVRDAALVRARRSHRVVLDPAAYHAIALRHGAAVDPRERGTHPRDRLRGRGIQDRGGDALWPVRRPRRRALCPAKPLRRAGFRLFSGLRRDGDLQCHGRDRYPGGTDRRRRFLPAVARGVLPVLHRVLSHSRRRDFHRHGDLHAARPARLHAALAQSIARPRGNAELSVARCKRQRWHAPRLSTNITPNLIAAGTEGKATMAKFGIGQAVRRVEDRRVLRGQRRYVDDITLPGQCYAITVLSPHAHARIKRIDVAKAKAAPGVLCVLTGADAAAEKLGSFTAHLMPEDFGAPKGHRTFQPLLTADKARFVGDRVAFVVAETPAQARDAAELVEVDYEVLPAALQLQAPAHEGAPAVVELEDAAKEGAIKVWEDCPQGNVGFGLMFGNKEATDAAFAGAKHVVKLRVENNRLSPVAMEPRAAIGDYNAAEDFCTLYTTSQNPHGVRMEMSHVFHVAENQMREISPDVGGGFGIKGNVFPDDALVLWASRRLRRPVKWVATRSESMLTDHCGRETVYYGELALDEIGKVLALRARVLFQLGAYFVGAALAAGAFSVRFIPEAYDIQTMHILSQGLFTNTSQSGPYRGAGRPEAAYFTERL